MTATDKLAILQCVSEQITETSQRKALHSAGISAGTYARWLDAYRTGGVEALDDRRAGRTGRRPVARHLSPEALEYLRKLLAGCGSLASVIDQFEFSPLCPPELKGVLASRRSRHHIPLSIRRAVCLTPEQQAMFNGPKQFAESAFIQRRDMTHIDLATGQRVPVAPGDWWELDDQSTNQPFWFELPAGQNFTRQGTSDRLAERHGVALGRQGLFCVDIASGKWLSGELIGRPRDAYRAEDILRFIFRLFQDHGMPRCGLRLERGIWKARAITGEKIAMPEDQRQIVVNSLRDLGIHIEYCYQSRGKPFVEGGFDHLQTRMSIEATLRGWKDIGREAGAKERETKAMMRVKDGVLHPRDAGFPHQADLGVAYQEAIGFLNTHAKEGRLLQGVPDELWQASIAAKPLRKLHMKHAGVFLPEKFDTCLRGGHVSKTINGTQYFFGAPEITARLGNGYRVFACFDPSDPWRGAELFNLETGTRNILSLPVGAHIGTAEWSEPAPQFGMGAKETSEQRKRYTRAFRSVYFASGLAGSRGRRILEERDGAGGLRREQREADFAQKRNVSEVSPLRASAPPREKISSPSSVSVFALASTSLPGPTDADLDATEAAGAAAMAELAELAFQ